MPDIMNNLSWDDALQLHRQSAETFSAYAKSGSWKTVSEEGKWSQAHVLEHLTRVYEVLLKELNSGKGMRILTIRPLQWILRQTILRKILRGGYFPSGARAPRETRPVELPATRDGALARFEELAHQFHQTAEKTHSENPHRKLTHAYFGPISLPEAVLLCARHIQHHHRQLQKKS